MVFIIAEAGVNHRGDLAVAMEMVKAAKKAGADAVKFQSFTPSVLAPEPGEYRELLEKCWLSDDCHRMLKALCYYDRIEFMSTPFDKERVDFLVELGVRRIKIGSGQVKDIDFVRHVASRKLPVIMSNGMATDEQWRAASEALWLADVDATLLFCVSEYPTPLHKIDLRKMRSFTSLGDKFGFSDHTGNPATSIIAAASGASVIEAHFSLDKTQPGPDQSSSLSVEEFTYMVSEIRKI